MKYYIIAGEASGDLHGSNLIRQIKSKDADANIRAWGGSLMQQQGATIVKDYKDLAFMGFVEVVINLRTILKNIKFCKQDILAFNPDVIVFIDYPGFNIKIAEWAKEKNLKQSITYLHKSGHGRKKEYIQLKNVLIKCSLFFLLKKIIIINGIIKLSMSGIL